MAGEPEAEETSDSKTLGARKDEGKMSLSDAGGLVGRVIQDAVSFTEQELSPRRAIFNKYYLGSPLGNEVEGRSRIVMTAVRDTVKAMMPSLMRMFFGPDRVVEYTSYDGNGVDAADQLTDYVNDVVLAVDNGGFLQFHAWMQDALVRRIGVMKYWVDHRETETEETVEGITGSEAAALTETGSKYETITLLSLEASDTLPAPPPPPPQPGQPPAPPAPPEPLYTAKLRRVTREPVHRLEAVPPEEFIYNREARSLESALFYGHKTRKRRGDLIALGVPEEDVEQMQGSLTQVATAEEVYSRAPQELAFGANDRTDDSTDLIDYVEGYVLMDFEGDGVPARYRVCTVGSNYQLVGEPTRVEEHNPGFALLSPFLEAHTLSGLSVSDDTVDLQYTTTMLWRAMLDSLAGSIFPRIGYVEGEVNAEDINSPAVGQPIRMRAPGMIQAIETPFNGERAAPIIAALETVKANRTGIRDGAAGLNPDALQSSTQAAVAAAVTASQQQVEMIARVFAETGVKDLFRGLAVLLAQYPPRRRIAKLRGQYVEIDPAAWDQPLHVSVNVALGTGLLEKKVAVLMQVVAKQEQYLQMLGPSNPLVSLAQLSSTLRRAVKLMGLSDAENYFNPVDPKWQPPPPPPPQEDQAKQAEAQATMQLVQIEGQKAQLKGQEMQHKAQMAEAQLQLKIREHEIADREAALGQQRESQKLETETQQFYDKLQSENAFKRYALELEYKSKIDLQQLDRQLELDKHAQQLHADLVREGVARPQVSSEDGSPLRVRRSVRMVRNEHGHLTGAEITDEPLTGGTA